MTTAFPRFPRHKLNPATDLLEADHSDKSFVERGRAVTLLMLAVLDNTPLFSVEVDAVLGTYQGNTNVRTMAHASKRQPQEGEFRTRLAYLIEAYRGTLPVPGVLKMEQAEWCDRVFKTLAYSMALDDVERNAKTMIRGVRAFVDPWPVKDMKADDPGYYAQLWRFLFPPLDHVADPRTFSIMEEMEALFATVENPWQNREDVRVKSCMPTSAEELSEQLVMAFVARGRNWNPVVRVPYGPALDPIINQFLEILNARNRRTLHMLVTSPRTNWLTVLQHTRGSAHPPPSIEATERWLKELSCLLGALFIERCPRLRGIVRNADPAVEPYDGLVMTTDPAVLLEFKNGPKPIG